MDGREWVGPAAALGREHVHCDYASCRWAGSAAEVRQHQVLCQRLAAAEETSGQLAARLAAVEVCSSELAARLAVVSEGLSQRIATLEESNGWLVQESCNLAARLASAEQYFGWLLGTVVPGLVKKGQEAAQGTASNGSGDAQPTAASSSDTLDHPNSNDREPARLLGLHDQAAPVSALSTPGQSSLPIGLLFASAHKTSVGMMSAAKDIPAVKDMLCKAGRLLSCDVLKLCLEGPESRFREIDAPLTYIACLAGLEKLRLEREEAVTRARAMAGDDVGEFAALTAAGVFSFEDGLRLLKVRQEAMGEVAMATKQRSHWVEGLDKPKLVELCVAAEKQGGPGSLCQISGALFPRGFLVSGTLKSAQALKKLAEKEADTREAQLLSAIAFYTPLMKPVQEKLSAALDELLPKMRPPRTTVYMNATAAPVRPGTDPEIIAELMKKQLVSCLLWEPSVRAMIQEGISEFLEVGPGQTLKDRMMRIDVEVGRNMTNIEI